MRAAKPLAALALTGIGSALVVGFQVPDTTQAVTPAATTATTTATTQATTSTSTTTVTTAAAASYADGTYAGTAVNEPWGTFQVQATVSGGVITKVVVVSAPTDGHSSRINTQAVPVLTQAALASQSADIDMISGATWTSDSYTTSLQGALDAARAAAENAA